MELKNANLIAAVKKVGEDQVLRWMEIGQHDREYRKKRNELQAELIRLAKKDPKLQAAAKAAVEKDLKVG